MKKIFTIIILIALANIVCSQTITVEEIKEPNIPTIIKINRDNSNFICFNIFIKNNNTEKPVDGIAHFVEHMLFGSSKNLQLGELDQEIETLGSSADAFTSYDFTVIRVTIRKENLDAAVRLLAETVNGPIFNENEIEIEKKIIADEFSRKEYLGFDFIKNKLFYQLYGNTNYGRPLEGELIENITKDDCQLYYENNYYIQNMLIVAAGNIDKEILTNTVKKYFTNTTRKETFIIPPSFKYNNATKISTFKEKAYFGFGYSFAPAYLKGEAIVSSILSALIYNKINEKIKDYSYEIKYSHNIQKWASPFILMFKSTKNIDDIESISYKTIADIGAGKFSDIDIANAKNFLLSDFLTKNQNMDTLTYQIGQIYMLYDLKTISDYTELVNNVSKEDILLAYEKYIR